MEQSQRKRSTMKLEISWMSMTLMAQKERRHTLDKHHMTHSTTMILLKPDSLVTDP